MPEPPSPIEPTCTRRPPLLDTTEVRKRLEEVPGWQVEGTRLTRDFSLDGFDQIVRLVNAVCDISRREDHHPQVMFGFKHIRVEYWTHTAGGVTRNDFICAKQINTWMETNT